MRNIDFIIVHCSGTDINVSIDILKKNAIEDGFKDIPYHYLITQDGCVIQGRSLDVVGAHCKGFNQRSIGICLVGGKKGFDFTLLQIIQLVLLLKHLCKQFNIAKSDIYSHYEFNKNKTCPNFNIKNLLKYEDFETISTTDY